MCSSSLTGDARPRFFESSLRFARGAGAARAREAMTVIVSLQVLARAACACKEVASSRVPLRLANQSSKHEHEQQ